MDRTSINYGLMLKDDCKAREYFEGDDWLYKGGLDYLIVIHIVYSSMLIINDPVVHMLIINDRVVHTNTCTYDHTKCLVGKRT